MANKVTGSTDTSGALSVAPISAKSVIIVGVTTGTPTTTTAVNTMFSISGTADAKARFGDESPIVKMVKILITNGVDYINGIIVDKVLTGDETIADKYEAALNVTLTDKSVKCVLLDTNVATVNTVVKEHLTVAESQDLFRYAVIAPDASATSQTDLISFALTFNDSRIFIPGPNIVDSENTSLSPVLIMAGLTSVIMTETADPALPMNGVQILGVGSVGRVMLDAEEGILATKGVTTLYNNAGIPTIKRLVTSYTTDAIWQEGTTRFIADYVLESVENILRVNYKRTKSVVRILDAIKTDVKTVLENLAGLEIIENFDASTLTVVKDPTDMYGALVDYEFDVVTPLYTITINQHMKL